MAKFDRKKLEDALSVLQQMKSSATTGSVHWTALPWTMPTLETAIECVDFVREITFCSECCHRENCWVDDDDYCSNGDRRNDNG